MYNEKQKKRFLSWIADSFAYANKCKTFFEKVSMIESYLDKDICFMTEDELEPLQNVFYGNAEAHRFIKKYAAWCATNGIIRPDAPIFNLSFVSGSKKSEKNIISSMFYSPSHLADEINAVFGTIYQSAVCNLYRCYLSMLYCLIPDDLTIRILSRDVKQNGEQIEHNGVVYFIYKELSNNITNMIAKPNTPLLYAGYGWQSTEDVKENMDAFIRKRVFKTNRKSSVKFDADKIMLSGVYYKLFTREQVGIPIDIERTISASFGNISNMVLQKYSNEYEEWKSIFYPNEK